MTTRRRLGRLAVVGIVGVSGALAGCSADDDAGTTTSDLDGLAATATSSATPTAPAVTTVATSTAPTTSSTVEPDVDTTTAPEAPAADPVDVLGVGSIVLDDVTEPGPHPVLGWEPVPGAASYWLTVTDGAGRPFWAWTGTATTVRVGGGPSAELNQTAAIHEPMTWRVAALDSNGVLVALSEPGDLAPG